MKSLGKKLLEAAKESDSPLAKMIVDGKYKTQKEASDSRNPLKPSKKRNRKRRNKSFRKPTPKDHRPEVAEAKPQS